MIQLDILFGLARSRFAGRCRWSLAEEVFEIVLATVALSFLSAASYPKSYVQNTCLSLQRRSIGANGLEHGRPIPSSFICLTWRSIHPYNAAMAEWAV